jgi:protein-S-isoprenylcysteine O-methyltransferase Ste14
MENALVPAALLFFLVAAFAWPTVRVWRRHGVWPIVFGREAAPAQRLLGWLSMGLLLALLGTGAARLAVGAGPLGVWAAPAAVGALGWALMAGGTALVMGAQRRMGASWRVGIDDRPTGLVTGGVFGLVRNPIFTGMLLVLAGYACLTPAWWSAGLWAATAIGFRVQIGWEERHLVALHGLTYLAYAARVGRLVPWIGRLRAPATPPGHPVRG